MTGRRWRLVCLATGVALPTLGGCERGSGQVPAERPAPLPAPQPVVGPHADAATASAPSVSAPPTPAEVADAKSAETTPEPTSPPGPREDGSCNAKEDCAPPATCARENAIVGKQRRSGSYCTTPRDQCQAWDDQKCGARAACLFSKAVKRWTCQPVTVRGLID